MSALQKLQAKIKDWQKDHKILMEENIRLRGQLNAMGNQEETDKQKEYCAKLQETINALRLELEEKDEEIEKIIIQVESILE
jgi:predicted RNase H-like nuclease (RuvC/YqgF family)